MTTFHAKFCDTEFEKAGVDISKPMVGSCGSGITACIVILAAHLLNKQVPLYDVRLNVRIKNYYYYYYYFLFLFNAIGILGAVGARCPSFF